MWAESAAVALVSNLLSTAVKRSLQMIYVCPQSQLRESQTTGTCLGNANVWKESFIYPCVCICYSTVGPSVSYVRQPCADAAEPADDGSRPAQRTSDPIRTAAKPATLRKVAPSAEGRRNGGKSQAGRHSRLLAPRSPACASAWRASRQRIASDRSLAINRSCVLFSRYPPIKSNTKWPIKHLQL